MLWRFRREIIFIVLILIAIWLIKYGVSFRAFFSKHMTTSGNFQPGVERIINENEQLKKLLGLKQSGNFSHVVYAGVKTISPWVFPSVIVVDKGTENGVREGMSVISSSGSLIGRIITVNKNDSTAITLYHPDSKVSVMVLSTGELAVIEGVSVASLYPYLRIKFLPPECKASVGDIVETSGLTRLFPLHIKVGIILKIDRSGSEPIAQGIVSPFFIHENINTVALVE
ncbi:MAG TPA: rod shape-determining protein MreC [bacterium]|nr:rod shape-determining protein MreC [bacterium]HOL35561.1 rod shape-determining protein MreC [bacterium]HPP08334.1 rod shape-determining protein MreC [bacterium]